MTGTFIDDKKPHGVGISDIEDVFMRSLMVEERVLATAKVNNRPVEARASYACIKQAKHFLHSMYIYAGAQLTDAMTEWLTAEEPIGDYRYLDDWCPFWKRWKDNLEFDAETMEWHCPLSHPSQLLLFSMFGEHCCSCMYAYYGRTEGHCLGGVRSDLYDYCGPSCSHYKDDGLFMAGVDENDDSYETAVAEIEKQNERRITAWQEEGKPSFPPEGKNMAMENDPKVIATLRRFGLSRKPLKEEK